MQRKQKALKPLRLSTSQGYFSLLLHPLVCTVPPWDPGSTEPLPSGTLPSSMAEGEGKSCVSFQSFHSEATQLTSVRIYCPKCQSKSRGHAQLQGREGAGNDLPYARGEDQEFVVASTDAKAEFTAEET